MTMSKTEIANRALSLIGQPQITGFEEQSESARMIRTNFKNDTEVVLSQGEWSFATNMDILTLAGGINEKKYPNYSYIYIKPDKCLRIRKIRNGSAPLSYKSEIEVEEEYYREVVDYGYQLILSNVPNAIIEYIRMEDDSALWSPQFCDALAYKLALSISSSLTGHTDRTGDIYQLYQGALATARAINHSNENLESVKPLRMVESRFHGGRVRGRR